MHYRMQQQKEGTVKKFFASIILALAILGGGASVSAGVIGTPVCQPRAICGTQAPTPKVGTPVRGNGSNVAAKPRTGTPYVRVQPTPNVPTLHCYWHYRNGMYQQTCQYL